MVHRPSFLALDILDGRTIYPIDDGLCLFRNSAPDQFRTQTELARVHLLQLEPCSFIRGSGSRTAAGLAELRHNRRHARRGTLSAWGGHPETCGPAQSNRKSKISEHSEHHHPGHIYLRVQVHAPGYDCARARLPRQHSTVPALETGHALAWVALPMFTVVWLAATIIIYTNSRLVLALGLTVCAICCWLWSHVDTSWSGNSFEIVELLLSLGLAGAYIGLVGSIVLEALESGALTSASNVATFSGFMHLMRIFGGQIGVAVMTRFIAVREQFHSNMLGLYIQRGTGLRISECGC